MRQSLFECGKLRRRYDEGEYVTKVTLYPAGEADYKSLISKEKTFLLQNKTKKAYREEATSGSYMPSLSNDTPFYIDTLSQKSESVKESGEKHLSTVESGYMETAQLDALEYKKAPPIDGGDFSYYLKIEF